MFRATARLVQIHDDVVALSRDGDVRVDVAISRLNAFDRQSIAAVRRAQIPQDDAAARQ